MTAWQISVRVGGFQNPGVCLQPFPSFPFPSPLFYLLHLWPCNSFFITAQKCLLRRLMETKPTVYSPYPRKFEHATICRYNYKDSTFFSVILRPWVLVRSKYSSKNYCTTIIFHVWQGYMWLDMQRAYYCIKTMFTFYVLPWLQKKEWPSYHLKQCCTRFLYM